MSEIVQFDRSAGTPLLVEVDDDDVGMERVSRGEDGIVQAATDLDAAIEAAQPSIETVVAALRKMAPDEHEIEFGLKLNAEAGVIVAKTALEGHFNVKLTWRNRTE